MQAGERGCYNDNLHIGSKACNNINVKLYLPKLVAFPLNKQLVNFMTGQLLVFLKRILASPAHMRESLFRLVVFQLSTQLN